MNALWILAGALVWFAVAYRGYGAFLARLVGVDPRRPTPAYRLHDGVDYVPAKSWVVLFGHHFSSICGAGPIVGPALAVAYWGWLPSLAWILLGCVLFGAVSDFVALFVSVRADGRSVPEIARPEISPRARILFSCFILLSLVLVNAVFAIFAARTFIQEPHVVVPSLGLIPVAVLTGWLLYRTRVRDGVATAVGLGLLVAGLAGGELLPVTLPAVAGLSPESLWILVLLAYCFVASVTPVQILLQPRDYLAGFLLFAAIGLGIAGTAWSRPVMQADAYRAFTPSDWAAAGPLWPMLFVTIACGAISGFHALVSSGTTCKQIASEGHACRIGYGGMLTEGLVAVLVVIAVGAGLGHDQLAATLRGGGPIAAFGEGYGVVTAPILGTFGKPFAVLALNAFILTTLDTATRIGRYLVQELLGLRNMYVATAIVVGGAAAVGLTGQWARIWPAFGAANQLIGGLALLVASCWLLRRGRRVVYTLVPACAMLLTTVAAFGYQAAEAVRRTEPDWFIAGVSAVLVVLAISVFADGVRVLAAGRASPAALREEA
jgi:carbon starvation protein